MILWQSSWTKKDVPSNIKHIQNGIKTNTIIWTAMKRHIVTGTIIILSGATKNNNLITYDELINSCTYIKGKF